MNNVTYILKRDLKRIFTNWVALLVVIGVCILPSFYAWFNIGANYDPYHNTSQVKIAVSSDDLGTTFNKKQLNAGDKIEKNLKKNKKIGWTFVSTEQAKEGVRSGEYYAAIIIPETFSKDLTSFIRGDINSPTIEYYVNEKKNAIAPKITDTGASTVQQVVDSIFKATVTKVIAKVLKESAGKIKNGMMDGSGNLVVSIEKTQNVIGEYQATIKQFHASKDSYTRTVSNALALNRSLDKNLTALRGTLGTGDKIIATAKADTAYLTAEIKKFQEENPGVLVVVTDKLLSDLNDMDIKLMKADRAITGAGGLITTIHPATSITPNILNNLNSSLKYADKSLTSMSSALSSTNQLLEEAKADLRTLQSADSYETLTAVSQLNDKKLSEFMAAPIELKQVKLYPVKNYGSGMTPFFTMLAIWVSGFILIAIFHLEVDTEEEEKRQITMTQRYFGRGILFTVLGLIQAAIICAGDIWILGIQCVHPVLFILAGLVASVVFVNLIYALAITFRHVGKALAVILVILQIPGSSGTYPIELTSDFFQKINPLLPFTYGISAMRETIGGFYGYTYWISLLVLLVFLGLALFIGLVLRPLLKNITHTFDTRLEDTGLFEAESAPDTQKIKTVKKVMRIIGSSEEGKEELEYRTKYFEEKYQGMLGKGIIIALIPPIVLLLLLFLLPSSPVLLCLWILSVILVCVFLFVVEHLHITISEHKYKQEIEGIEEVSRNE